MYCNELKGGRLKVVECCGHLADGVFASPSLSSGCPASGEDRWSHQKNGVCTETFRYLEVQSLVCKFRAMEDGVGSTMVNLTSCFFNPGGTPKLRFLFGSISMGKRSHLPVVCTESTMGILRSRLQISGTLWLCQQFAIENGHRNSGFSHWKWWFSIVFCMFSRG